MKRIWNAIGKSTKDNHFRVKAVQHVEKIEAGKVKVVAPKVPTEEKRFAEAQADQEAKEDLTKMHTKLIENMEKITIRSTDPAPREQNKPLPTRDSEWEHRNDPIWEYGFYEPPIEKIPKGKLMFREAMEILRAKQEMNFEGSSPAAARRREIGKEEYDKSQAIPRLNEELINDMYEYFRPFERKDNQKIVNKHDLAKLQDFLQGRSEEEMMNLGEIKEHVQQMLKDKVTRENYDRLTDEEKKQFLEAIKTIRTEERQRLEGRLKQINQIEEGIKKAQEEAATKIQKEKSTQ